MARQRNVRVRIGADTTDIKKGVKESEGLLAGFGKKIGAAGAAMAAAFGAGAIVAGISAAVTELTRFADKLFDLESATGIAVEKLQEYQHVARIAGVEADTMANAVLGLTRRLARGSEEAGPLVDALGHFGIAIRNTDGSMRSGAVIMEELIAGLSGMENRTERNVIAAKAFGGTWTELAPILDMGAEGLSKAAEEARKLGLVMTETELRAADALRARLETLGAQWRQALRDVIIAAEPVLTWLAKEISKGFAPDDVEVKYNPRLELGHLERALESVEMQLHNAFKRYQDLEKTEGTTRKQLEKQHERIVQLAESHKRIEERILKTKTDIANLTAQEAADEAANTAAAAAAAEVESNAAAAAEQKRRAELGEIGRLREDLSKAELAFIAAADHAGRVSAQQRIILLKEEIRLLTEAAELAAARMPALDKMPTLAAPEGDDPYITMMERRTEAAITHYTLAEQMAERQGKLDETQIQNLERIAEGMANLLATGRATASDMIKIMIAEATAALIKQIMVSIPFPANIALAMGAGAIVGSLKGQIPEFAQGGIAYAPTIGRFGEYPGARHNPEIIAPLDRLQQLIGDRGSYVDVDVNVQGIVSGKNIFVTNERFGRHKRLVE